MTPIRFRIPVRIRQFPRFVGQTLERSLILRRPLSNSPTFHLCFFSCQSYFKYLYCSLHSLTQHAQGIRFKVLVFSDEDMPLSAAQIDAIKALIPETRVIPWPKSMGWGATQIGSIWRAYGLAAEGVANNDIIARVDSDVFFFNDRIFRAVARSEADLIGDGHYVNFEYTQGGCYFFRASAVRKINAVFDVEPIDSILKEIDIVVEDIAAHHFAKRLGLKIWMTWFMMFPDELRNAGGLTAWQRWKFSCLHFVMKNKAAMLEAYDRELLDGKSLESFKTALEIG
jgi:hypothetical protein